MKKLKLFTTLLASAVVSCPVFADVIILNWGNGQSMAVNTDDLAAGLTGVGNVPYDVVRIVAEHKSEIEAALTNSGVTSAQAQAGVIQAKNAYDNFARYNGFVLNNPYTDTINGLNDFSDVLMDVIPNTQIQQNVWANAWIGHILPKPNFGFGINTGISKLDLSPLAHVAKSLGMRDYSDIPGSIVMPTVTADIRVGGFILPFDVGFTAMSIDANTVRPVGKAMDPTGFDLFMIGGDVRYAILEGGFLRPKLSVGLGAYYTKGNFGVEQDGSSAELDFSTTSIVLSTQASIKVLSFVPFVGARVMMSKSNVDWKVHANWASILSTSNSSIANALAWGILPSNFSDGVSSNFGSHVRPVLYAGCSIDMLVVDFTLSASYDVISKIPSAAASLRLALN
jgi:hypothetical protein